MQNIFQRLDMSIVLAYGVSELIFVAVYVLCPVFALFSTIDPSFVRLGFDNEDSVD